MQNDPKDVALALLLGWQQGLAGCWWREPISPDEGNHLPRLSDNGPLQNDYERGDRTIFCRNAECVLAYEIQVTPK